MSLVLPPGVTRAAFDAALAAFAGVVGRQWVLASDEDRETYLDIYAAGDEADHAPSAAVAPESTEQVQAIVRLANAHRIPLWPISRGKNFGYGGSAPRMSGTVILDLGRMKRILEVNEPLGYCIIEPGVGFYDLHDYLTARKIPLWMSIPGNGWGSVVGNALERGFAATPYGDHTANICGMEVVLPSGDLVRTGMGAMANSRAWPLFKHGFGPSWDQIFVQSNYGVVTRLALWLMPQPEEVLTLTMSVPEPDDLGWLIDVLTPLRIRGVLEHPIGITSYLSAATTTSQRSEWYQGEGAIPESVIREIMSKRAVGWWNFTLRLYGHAEINQARLNVVRRAFAAHTRQQFQITRWSAANPTHGPGAPAPTVAPLQMINWHGGRGGHLGFSPVVPPEAGRVLEQMHATRRRYDECGIDYSSTFYVCGRHVTNINLILYNRDDPHMTANVHRLFDALVKDSAAKGYGEYRTHLSYMDQVAASFDFNGHALQRLNETVKDALDPNGILAPGKNGIWPRALRKPTGSP